MEKSIIDKYQIMREIGRGGMGRVYQVKDIHLDKLWAMKVVHLDYELPKEYQKLYLEQLEKEANALKKLEHPLLPVIVDLIYIENGIAIVMEYIEGITLEHYIEEHGIVPQKQAVLWGIQLVEVLDYLHSRHPSIIYGDMKPSNIMVCQNGSIKVIDFGTVMEETCIKGNSRLGTYGYAAPELIKKEKKGSVLNDTKTDQRSDIYSFGATLYHMVTGECPAKPPYKIRPIRELNATLSEGLEKIIIRCTKKSPDERYQSCNECKKDLKQYKQLELRYKCVKRMLSMLCGCFALCAIIYLCIGILHTYREYDNEATIDALISVISAGLTLTIRRICVVHRQQKYFSVKQERNIIRTEKKVIGLWCLMVMVFIHTTYCYAENTATLPIQVRDSQGRYILIREGCIYRCTEPLIFTWPEEENMRYEISLGHGKWKEAKDNQYLFSGHIQEKKERVIRINFRGQNKQLKSYFTRSFRLMVS